MRRQNYEFQVSRPQVITKMIDGKLCEPIEYLMIEVPDSYVGAVKVYPVPAVDNVTVKAAGNINSLRMTAANGAIVKDEKGAGQNKATLYVGDLPAGVYLLTVNGKTTVEVIKK